MAANSYRNVFLTNLATIPSSGTTLDLGIGQLGIVNVKTNTLTSAPNFPAVRSIQIAQGTSDKKLPQGFQKGNQTWRTPEIPASSDIQFYALPAQKLQNMIVTLGYDGVDATKTMAPRQSKDVRLFVTLTGQPIANLVGNTGNHPAAITETFDLVLPCVGECVDDCGTLVDCNYVADAIISQMSKRKTIGSVQLIDGVDGEPGLLRLTKLLSCTTPSGLPTEACSIWSLVVADNGDQPALGAVQAQYPGEDVVRASRTGIYSTYTITCPATDPADFNPSESLITIDCECPSGWTEAASFDVYTVTVPGKRASTYLNSVTGFHSASILSYDGVSTILTLAVTAGTSQATLLSEVQALGTNAGGTVVASGALQRTCTPPSGANIAWTESGTCAKASKTYQLTVKGDCADSYCTTTLATLNEIYGDLGEVTLAASANCTCQFNLTIESDNVCVDCANVDDQYFTFTKPQNFGTSIWTEVSGPVYGEDCSCGIRFESAYVARDRKECFFEDVSYEVEPLFIYVSTTNPDFRDYSTLCNEDEVFPVTLIQTAKYRQGYGSSVAEQVKLSNFYFNDPWFNDPAVRDAVGYSLNTDLQGYYDQYTLIWKSGKGGSSNVSGFGLSQFEQFEWTFYTPQGEGTALANAINSWLASVGAETASI